MSNCSFEAVDNLMSSLQLVIYIPIFIFGFILNSLALLALYFFWKEQPSFNYYRTNLALMDMLLLSLMPFKMHATKHQWTADKRLFCSFLESLYFVSVYGGIYTIMCWTVHLCIAAMHPLLLQAYYPCSPRAAPATCALIWVLALGAAGPVYSFRSKDESAFRCFHGFSEEAWSPALIACLEVLGFLVPALVLVTCSVLISRTLRALRHRGYRSITLRNVRFIYIYLCVILVPFTPLHVGIFLQFLVRNDIITDCDLQNNISLFLQVAMSLSNITCCLHAFCHYRATGEMRGIVREIRGIVREIRGIVREIRQVLAIRTTGETLRQSFNLRGPTRTTEL